MIIKSGYANLDVLREVRRQNNLCTNCNDVQVGQTYCIPRQTPTASPPGYPATLAKQTQELPNLVTNNQTTGYYTVVEGDTITSVVLKTRVSLREICQLNNPDPVNCALCQFDAPVGNWG